jgi:glycosyltransferase involved in cell wall biosynthesis
MRVALLGSRNLPARHGGLERAVEELAAELVAHGHAVTAYVDRAEVQTSTHRGIAVVGCRALRTRHLHTLTQVVDSVPRAIRSDPDVIHFQGSGPGVLSVVTRRSAPSVVTFQGLDWTRDKWGSTARQLFRVATRLSVKAPHAVVAVSRTLQRQLQDTYGREVHYIPNGVRAARPVSPGPVLEELGLSERSYILFASRLVPEKGADTLIEAHELMSSQLPLVVAGGGAGSYESGFERKLRQRAGSRVVFAGFRTGTALTELFTNAAAYVLPSTIEGLPISLLEAMSFGLPIVHSNIPESVEVTRGDAALTFEVGNAAQLARALDRLLEDHQLASELGARAVERVCSEYSWSDVMKSNLALYEHLVTAAR